MGAITAESILYAEKDMVDRLTPEGELVEDKRNGHGYVMFEPYTPTSPHANEATITGCVSQRFLEIPYVMQKALDAGSVLLEGSPGAGKSNILQDLERCSRLASTPLLRIALHINAGTTRTIEQSVTMLQQYQERFQDIGGMLLLDNVDYGGYKGSKRTRKNAFEYAEAVLPVLTDTVQSNHIVAIGTAHDDRWRESKWQWNDPLINSHASNLLEAFQSRHDFQGSMTEDSLRELLEHRSGNVDTAEKVTRKLGELGLLSFYYGNHVNPDEFISDPEAALNRVEVGRRERYGYPQ